MLTLACSPCFLMVAALGTGSFWVSRPTQAPDPLDRVEALLGQGRMESARSVLMAWWDSAFAGASRFRQQRGLWLRGLLTVDPELAARDFRRLVLEYPGGAFSDQALFRLALWAEIRGDTAQAAAHFRSLLLEYPASPLVPAAQERLAGKGVSLDRVEGGRAGEGRNRPAPDAGTLVREAYGAQLGAYRSEQAARALMDRLRRAGYEPRLVRLPGSELLRVRVGELATRAEAWALVQELREKGFEPLLISDVAREERRR